MTSDYMGYRLLAGSEHIHSDDAQGLTEREQSLLLTEAQEQVVIDRINPKGNRSNTGFDETELRKKGLSELIARSGCTGVTGADLTALSVPTNGVAYRLPSDAWLVVSEEATLGFTGIAGTGTTQEVLVKPITYDEFTANRKNPFTKPFVNESDGEIWRLDVGNPDDTEEEKMHILILPTGSTVSSYKVSYLKQLEPIVVTGATFEGVTGPQNSILDESLHPAIVAEAIKRVSARIADLRKYQIDLAEAQRSE